VHQTRGPGIQTTRYPFEESSCDVASRPDRRRGADLPLAAQIRDGIRRAIEQGTLRPAARLPSTRQLAEDLGVSAASR